MDRNTQHKNYLRAHIIKSRWYKVFIAAAAVVVFITTYMLILPAITLDAHCGQEEHVHSDTCYTSESTVVCGSKEYAGHTHSEECYQTTEDLICGQEESEPVVEEVVNEETGEVETVIVSEGHTHSADCYQQNTELICGQEETAGHTHDQSCYREDKTLTCGQEEHTHSEECYHEQSDPNADVENEEIWKQTFAHIQLTGNWSEDIVAIAETQIGYQESSKNFVYDSDDEKEGYTRYGAWYGDTYGEWCAMFASFCVYYAEVGYDVNNVPFPLESNSTNWINKLQQIGYYHDAASTLYMDQLGRETYIGEDYFLEPGDLIFFNLKNSEYVVSDHVGIVTDVTDKKITTIQGNSNYSVVEKDYNVGDITIVGFGEIPENPNYVDPDKVDETEVSEAEESDSETEVKETKKDQTDKKAAKSESAVNTEEEESEKDAEKTVLYPAQGFEASANGIHVTVTADEGAFPADAGMVLYSVTDSELLEKAIEVSGTENAEAKAVDISFVDADGREIEPEKAIRVTLQADELAATNDVTVVHFDESNDVSIIEQTAVQYLSEDEQPTADEVVFDSDTFSTYAIVYTVDFNYGEYQISIPGGSSIYLSELLEQLHIYKEDQSLVTIDDIRDVQFTDETLVVITQPDDDWILTSLQPFLSDEKLTLILRNGSVITIDVSDAQMVVTGTKLTVNGTTYDLSTTSSLEIKETDSLEFLLNYEVPGGSLSAEDNIVEYPLPTGIKIREAITDRNITHGNEVVGTYSIDTNGIITFVYNDDYVTKNANGSKITADLSFSASVDASNIPDGGTVKISFSENLEVDVKVEKAEVGDLSVYKQADSNNFNDGYILYRINVTSTAGTSSEVNLTDVITNSGLNITSLSDFTIEPGNDSIKPTWNGTSGFGITLPQMDANSHYTITYRVNYDKTSVPLNGVSINNKITGESTGSKGSKLEHSYSVDTNVKPKDVISKTVENYAEAANTVSWKIKINESGSNLNGWTLKDTLNGAAYEGTVHVEPAIDGKNEISLPYKWEKDDWNTYTITYTTAADKLLGSNSVVNKAELTKDGESVSPGDTHAGWTDNAYNPISKDATKITSNEGDSTAVVDWKVTISASQGVIPAGWTYKDELWDGQWFTGTQLKVIKSAIDTALSQSGLNLRYTMKANLQQGEDGIGDEVDWNQIEDNLKYKVYTLYFTSDMQQGKSFTFSYQSTAPIEGVTEDKAFRNRANINDKVTKDGQIIYKPPKEPEIIKTDGNEANDSAHDINSTDETFKWDLKVTIPKDYKGTTLTVKEHLPAGVSLEDLEILAQGETASIFGATHFVSPQLGSNKLTIDGNSGPFEFDLVISKREDGGLDAVITLPENLVKHSDIQEVRFVVKVKPTDTSTWKKDGDGYLYEKYGNTVDLIDKDNQTISSDSHNQTITLKDGKKLIGKSVGSSDNGKFDANIVPYSLKINEDGLDLVEGASTITLTDVMKYEYNRYYLVNATYVNNSLAVYRMNKDGTKGEKLTTDEYSFTYEETIDYENLINNNPTAVRTLKVVLPDSTPLIVDYSYMVSDTNDAGRNTHLSNRAYLEGYNENRYSDEKSTYVVVQKSDAHASIEGITLQKVDADNFAIKLEGVKFSLFKYDQSSKSYVKVDKVYTTDSSGNINFTSKDIDYETAYKLVEESTIAGYFSEKAPYYFIVTDVELQAGKNPSYIAPDDFDGTVYSVGASFYFKNRKIPEKGLSVSKVWKDSDGNIIEDTSDMPGIKARLLKDGKVIKTFTLSEANGWTEIFKDLDADGEYTVEEATELIGYETPVIVYEQGDGVETSYLVGSSYGSATITNQPSSPPPSGGSTNVAVTKKWVGTDGKTELTGDDISDLTAEVELVRFRQQQVKGSGTTLHFVTGNGPGYAEFASQKIVDSHKTITIKLTSTYDSPMNLLLLTYDPWDMWDSHLTGGITISNTADYKAGYGLYTITTNGESDLYLWLSASHRTSLSEPTDMISADDLAADELVGDPQIDPTYSSHKVILSNTNDWTAVFTNLPTLEEVDGITYAYTYAIKEINCSEGFELQGFDVGEKERDSTNIPISNISSNITVTNKQKEEYELPATGGPGTLKYILSGFSLMIIALLLYIRRKPEEGRAV